MKRRTLSSISSGAAENTVLEKTFQTSAEQEPEIRQHQAFVVLLSFFVQRCCKLLTKKSLKIIKGL